MSLNKVIITPTEADVTLALESDWLLLTDPVKTDHIAKASVYVQTNWSCSEITWSDATTIGADIKEAVAYYALADFRGNLYPESSDLDDTQGFLTEETKVMGPMKKTLKYDTSKGTDEIYHLQYPDALMAPYCNRISGAGSVKAVRT